MVRPVSLSNPAFAALRSEKREGESDSDVVLRAIGALRASRRDPMRFATVAPKRARAMSFAEHSEFLRKMAMADRARAKRLWGEPRARP